MVGAQRRRRTDARARASGTLGSLRRAAAEEDGMDPDAVDPTFEAEFAACRARWPKFYKQDTPDQT